MDRKYFIRAHDFTEIIKYEKNQIYYVKEIYGEFCKIGNEEYEIENILNEFSTLDEQYEYFQKKVEYLLKIGNVESERQYLVKGLVTIEYIDGGNFYTYDSDSNSIIINKLKNIDCQKHKHIGIEFWSPKYKNKYGLIEILDYLIENKEKYQCVEYFSFGNIKWGSEICEISWIEQENYTEFFKAFPNIKGIFIQGMNNLKLGNMKLYNLEILEIEGSGLNNNILYDIINSDIPNLKRLSLYFGVEDYGLDIDINVLDKLLNETNFKNLKILSLCNMDHDICGDVLKLILNSKYSKQISVLDISLSALVDENAQYIIDNIHKLENIKYIDMSYNYFSDDMVDKLENLYDDILIEAIDNFGYVDDYDLYPMITE